MAVVSAPIALLAGYNIAKTATMDVCASVPAERWYRGWRIRFERRGPQSFTAYANKDGSGIAWSGEHTAKMAYNGVLQTIRRLELEACEAAHLKFSVHTDL